MRLVNGEYCANCTEELRAKRGLDPTAGPHRTQMKEQQAQRVDPVKATAPLGENRPVSEGHLGTRLDLRA